MTTEAGKRLLADWRHYDDCANVAAPLSNVDPVCISRESELREYIAAIEAEAHEAGRRSIEQDGTRDAWKAEAIAAERARIAEGVRDLFKWDEVARTAVLALIEEKP